jgi:hypothetical protein
MLALIRKRMRPSTPSGSPSQRPSSRLSAVSGRPLLIMSRSWSIWRSISVSTERSSHTVCRAILPAVCCSSLHEIPHRHSRNRCGVEIREAAVGIIEMSCGPTALRPPCYPNCYPTAWDKRKLSGTTRAAMSVFIRHSSTMGTDPPLSGITIPEFQDRCLKPLGHPSSAGTSIT